MRNAPKTALLSVVGGIFIASFITGCGEKNVASVDGVKITQSEYYQRLEQQPAGRDPETQKPIEAGASVLQQMINEKLLLRLAEKEKVPPTEEQVTERLEQLKKATPDYEDKLKELGLSEDQLKREIRIQQAAFNLQTKGMSVTEAQIKEYYEKNKNTEFTEPESANVAAIFAKDKADADKAMKLLDEKASFESVAKTYSQDKASAANGGVLSQPITKPDGDDTEPIATIMKTKPGEITKPISLGQGSYGIFKIIKHTDKRVKPLEEVEFQIKERLLTELGQQKNPSIKEQLDKFKKDAAIKVEISKYKEFLEKKDIQDESQPAPPAEVPESE